MNGQSSWVKTHLSSPHRWWLCPLCSCEFIFKGKHIPHNSSPKRAISQALAQTTKIRLSREKESREKRTHDDYRLWCSLWECQFLNKDRMEIAPDDRDLMQRSPRRDNQIFTDINLKKLARHLGQMLVSFCMRHLCSSHLRSSFICSNRP